MKEFITEALEVAVMVPVVWAVVYIFALFAGLV